jgi:hypothetical protein
MKKNTVWAYLGLVCAALALATIVAGLVAPGFAHSTFDTILIVLLLFGIVAAVLNFFLNWDFLPLVAAAFYGCGLGRIIFRGAEVIADKANNINFVGGSFEMVMVYIILMVLACVIAIVCCFRQNKKA